MATLGFNTHGYVFQESTEGIRRSYESALGALTARYEDLKRQYEKFIIDEAAGRSESYELDDDGSVLYCHKHAYEMMIEREYDSIVTLREAFIVILHHHWEKSCNFGMSVSRYKFETAYKWLKESGLTPDTSKLELIRRLCNAIKHQDYAVLDKFPDLFEQWRSHDNAWTLRKFVETVQFGDLVDAVKRSGMQTSGR